MSRSIHWHTPSLRVNDGRGLSVRRVEYLRDSSGAEAERLVTRQRYNPAGLQIAQWDPRHGGDAFPNQSHVHTLTGEPLKIDSVDAGWRLTLPGLAGEALQRWDGRGQHWLSTYDEQLRVVAVGVEGEPALETFTYADALADATHNLRGQMTALNDLSGTLTCDSFSLLGGSQAQTRIFDDDRPHRSQQTFGPLNQVLAQTDAGGHRQTLHYDLAGQLKQVGLQLASDTSAQAVVQDARYNAAGQLIERLGGNNVRSRWQYDPANGRLASLQAAVAGQPSLQHFAYVYDPVGNVLRIEDQTFQPVYFANQLIDGHRDFDYDSLYRLTRASGHDALPSPDAPGRPQPSDPANLRNYTQHYDYDSGGNLIKLAHGREVGGYTRQMLVDPGSNRALRWQTGDPAPDFSRFFDSHGNQRKLQHGPQLQWNAQDQLQQVTLLKHDNGLPDDREVYLYSQGERVSKRQESHTASTTHFLQVRYLPGLEIRTRDNGEELHVITLPGHVRCLHWQAKPPADIDNNQLRYSLDDHLGSSLLELDQRARVISRETYYPFGGTALWLPSSSASVDYKTVRYSGKEMDVSGLYYYGSRYYAPWLKRWVSADSSHEDGLNLYGFVKNNPMRYVDPDGQAGLDFSSLLNLFRTTANVASQAHDIATEFDGEDEANVSQSTRATMTFRRFLFSKKGMTAFSLSATVGTAIGGAAGSFAPVIGNSIGGVVGGLIGGLAGAYIRYRFFKRGIQVAEALHTADLRDVTRTIADGAEDVANGAIPRVIQDRLTQLKESAANLIFDQVKEWNPLDQLDFAQMIEMGNSINDAYRAIMDRASIALPQLASPNETAAEQTVEPERSQSRGQVVLELNRSGQFERPAGSVREQGLAGRANSYRRATRAPRRQTRFESAV
ncbi:RHS repeat domain-containing protein [Pseudomonas sp. PB106]|uniref:RHS repeat domain-containing protein n=1 Tax=Pseudomonas sp. PB106 TaxID=2494699 RepID=UPI00131BC1E0|nr:RHS repeat-associated core domain-containing protein [Pseudomonas sp. PB106]KAE9639210.1 RHS repeat protein [Pseudomonas sp. PB106]